MQAYNIAILLDVNWKINKNYKLTVEDQKTYYF